MLFWLRSIIHCEYSIYSARYVIRMLQILSAVNIGTL